MYPGMGAGEANNLETWTGTAKTPTHTPALSNQRTRKVAASQDRKLWDNKQSAPAKCHRQKLSHPYPHQEGPDGEPRCPSSPRWNEAHQLPNSVVSEKGKEQAGIVYSYEAVMSFPPILHNDSTTMWRAGTSTPTWQSCRFLPTPHCNGVRTGVERQDFHHCPALMVGYKAIPHPSPRNLGVNRNHVESSDEAFLPLPAKGDISGGLVQSYNPQPYPAVTRSPHLSWQQRQSTRLLPHLEIIRQRSHYYLFPW